MTDHLWWREWALSPDPALMLLVHEPFLAPELRALVGVPQNPVYHPEGDVFIHTMYVVMEAVRIAERDKLSRHERVVLVMAALCHDKGKPKTTVQNEKGNWTAPKHDSEGVKVAHRFLRRAGFSKAFYTRVGELVKRHMVHGSFVGEPSPRMVKRLAKNLEAVGSNIYELGRLVEADASGRPPLPKRLPPAYAQIIEAYQPLVTSN